MMSKKRGQATIFMVMAVVILLLGAFFFFTQRASLEQPILVSPEAVPIKNFVESCINNVAKQGIGILGANGGYITFPDSIENNPRSYLQLGPAGSIKNPYWWYEGIENIPQESFITRQIEDYVTMQLSTCISDFEAFSNQYDVVQLGEVTTQVTLNENDVTVDVTYPVELANKLNSTLISLESFKETLPIRLKKVYEAARDIMEAEKNGFFLEFKTIDLITLDEDIPTTGMEITCGQKVWESERVEQKLKRLLNVNLPYINVISSEFNDELYVPNPFGENNYRSSYYNSHYRWQISDKDYDGLSFSFNYDQRWPFQFVVRPASDGLLRSNAQKNEGLLDFLCLHIWHFTYDAVYPVRITITDTLGQEPYQFNFAFKVSIDHNQPNKENFASTLFEQQEIGDEEEYCNDVVNEITIFTKSNSTEQEDIADVNLEFTCGIFSCDIGKTDWISFGAAAGLTTNYPYCVNGILRANKDGFEQGQMFMQTEIPGEYTIYLKPIKEFVNYEVVKHDFERPATPTDLEELETASITISIEDEFESFGVYPSNEGLPLRLLNDNKEYDITIYLSDQENIIGGYKGKWFVSKEDLSDANSIRFHVLERQGSDEDRFLFISGLDSYSQQIPKPELV